MIFIFLLILRSVNPIEDAKIYSISATYKINVNNSVEESINYTLSSSINKSLIKISKEFSDLSINDGVNELNYTIIPSEKYNIINLTLNNTVKLNLKYVALNEIFQKNNVNLFYTNFDFKEPITKVDIKFILPKGYSIYKEEYSPKDANIVSDGNNILIIWTKGAYKSMTYSVSYYNPFLEENLNNSTTEQNNQEELSEIVKIFNFIKNNIRKLIIFILGLPLFFILFILSITLFIIKKFKKNTNELLLKGFMEDEQRAILYLQKNRVVWQNKLRKDLNLSRVKTTRIIKKLEAQGLIRKEDFGKTNKIFWNSK
ncbi:MAG: hypothetical protein QXE31_05830 [Candidatus Woesearchaeota archaeon]